jgi:hypothetical protein
MLLLKGPYGWDACEAEHISLLCDVENVPNQIDFEKIIDRFSAYRPAYQKIYNCLTHSGRYDCLVQASWFSVQKEELGELLKILGMELRHIASIQDWIYREHP